MRSHARPSSWATFFLVLLGAVTAGPGAAEDRDTFTEDGVLNGSATTEEACRWPDTSIWVVVDGQGDCLRYFHGGLKPRNQVIHVWLHGDRMWQDVAGRKGWYKGVGEAELEKIALARYAKDEIPYVGLSRPGTYGSSGNHAERRRPREVKLVLAAFDELKARYGVERFAISGISSGGHL
ncbi:MAG: hypothetical protein FJX47_02650, partial [Alphaproteobacteria bacterium]|nr:hypothetical protein [Alphaproteobacteria bacterium]